MDIFDLQSRVEELAEHVQTASRLQADTRIPWASLYDHLALTAALAVGMVSELWNRGWAAKDICGLELSRKELCVLARVCGLIHDIGKAQLGETEYRWHVQRGTEYMEKWFLEQGVAEPLSAVILGTIKRHHLRDEPSTPLEKIICLADSCASAGDRPELSQAETLEQFERVTQAAKKLEQELFGDKAPVCLLLGDADAIKSYVYETQVLPEIRGGSELLQEVEEEIDRRFRENLARECLVYCGGGGFLGIVPASEAQEWKEQLEALYVAMTKVATVTVVLSRPLWYADMARGLPPYTLEDVKKLQGQGVAADLLFSHFGTGDRAQRKNFGELVAYLTGELQQAKRGKSFVPFLETLPIFRRCQSCGKRVAASWDSVRAEWICDVCSQKRNKGRQEKRATLQKFGDWVARTKGIARQFTAPLDLSVLAEEEGKIALLYADGNNMGELLQRASSPAAYRHISDALKTATQEALFEALWETFGETGLTGNSLPFEIVAIGGDDVVVITTAPAGWALTVNILEQFAGHRKVQELNEEFRGRFGDDSPPLSMSAGLAIADVKYPVRFLFDLVEGLIRKAKRLARDRRTGALCHLWLRAPVISESAEDIFEALYRRQKDSLEWWLSARPYTTGEACRLHHLACQLKGTPSSFRRTLAESLERGVHVSLNYALYQIARIKEHRDVLWEAFENLGQLVSDNNPSAEGLLFWRKAEAAAKRSGRAWCTALLDVLELVELEAHEYPIVGGCP